MANPETDLGIFRKADTLSLKQLDSRQLDALREIGTMGAGAAATALSSLMKRRILIRVPELAVISRDEIETLLPNRGESTAVVSMNVLGDVNGTAMLVLEGRTATLLASSLLGMPVGEFPDEFDELAESTLIEVGNILAGAYLNTLSDFLGLMMVMSVPEFAIREPGALLQPQPVEAGQANEMLQIHTVFEIHEQLQLLNGDMIIAPTVPSLRAILRALRMG